MTGAPPPVAPAVQAHPASEPNAPAPATSPVPLPSTVPATPPPFPAAPITPAPPVVQTVFPAPRKVRSWSLGVGVGVLSTSTGGSALLNQGVSVSASTPTYRAALEGRLGPSTWLGLTGFVSYESTTAGVSSTQVPPLRSTINYRRSTIGGLLGLRQVVLSDVVDLSVYGAFGIGRVGIDGDPLQKGESSAAAPGSSARLWSLSGGITLERELIESLSLRASCELASVSSSRSTSINSADTPPVDSHAQAFQLGLAPALDLRFYF